MDQTAKIWDLETGKEIATLKVKFIKRLFIKYLYIIIVLIYLIIF